MWQITSTRQRKAATRQKPLSSSTSSFAFLFSCLKIETKQQQTKKKNEKEIRGQRLRVVLTNEPPPQRAPNSNFKSKQEIELNDQLNYDDPSFFLFQSAQIKQKMIRVHRREFLLIFEETKIKDGQRDGGTSVSPTQGTHMNTLLSLSLSLSVFLSLLTITPGTL